MLFNSFHFLLFFPIVTLFYFVLPQKIRWIWLLIASYYFYMCWNPTYALLMTASIVITYLSGLLIHRSNQLTDEKKRNFQRKLWVALSFSSNLAILFFFKYFHFAVDSVNRALSYLNIQALHPTFDVLLPVGISFYTFQALSYTIDVYRGELAAEKNIARYALFVSFFPQLVAGPIERSKNLLPQIHERHTFDYARVKSGLLLMTWGFFQKLVIADRAAILVNQVYTEYYLYSGVQIIVATLLFAIQIYCDFSGYTDIAKGAARVLGFRLMDNFHQPYFATSVQDFWRRWHISLSQWFRDCLYIPLGGNRVSHFRKYINTMIVFLVSGLWHGASWSYVVWGGLHGCFQIIGELTKPAKEKLYAKLHIRTNVFSFTLVKTLTTFFLVNFAWIFFRAGGTQTAIQMIQRIFQTFSLSAFFNGSLYTMGLNQREFAITLLAILILFLVDFAKYLKPDLHLGELFARQSLWFRWLAYFFIAIGALLVLAGLADYPQTQFIYFQF